MFQEIDFGAELSTEYLSLLFNLFNVFIGEFRSASEIPNYLFDENALKLFN
jgi:hypothetical protein